MHVCKKSCAKATVSDPNKTEYKNVCIQSQNPISNVYDFCDNKVDDDAESKRICKLDMCNLCCSTIDSIKHKQFSFDSQKKCFEDCNKEFNTSDIPERKR
jgi:hypothetical protein